MARIRTFNLTMTGSAVQVSSSHIPALEVHISNPSTTAGHTLTVGRSDVATVPGLTVPVGATDSPGYRVIGQGPSGAVATYLDDLYIKGTNTDVVQVLAVCL